jgi:DNA-binding transcriptional LysR family regulator
MDAAFIRIAPAGSPDVTVLPLLQEPMVAALPATHALAQGRRDDAIPLTSLAGETFILYGPAGTGMYDATIAACHAAGFNPRVGNLAASTQAAPRIASTLSLVAAGLGVCCVPFSLQRMTMEGVAYRALDGPSQPWALLNLAFRRGETSAVVGQFVRVARTIAGELSGPRSSPHAKD